jgi:CheY-like chemotaxis protein
VIVSSDLGFKIKRGGIHTMACQILLVGDDADACAAVVRLLGARGCTADVAPSGPSALKLADRHRYSIAIIDRQIPGMDGEELLGRLRERRPQLVGIFLNGLKALDACGSAGVARVLPKAMDFRELLPTIVDHVRATV